MNKELIQHEYWIEYISPLFSTRYGLIYHERGLKSYSREKQRFVDDHRLLFCLPLKAFLKEALKRRTKLITDHNSNVDHPDFIQFTTNMNDWMDKKDIDVPSLLNRHMPMIRLMIPPTWMVLFEIKLKLYKL